MNKFMNALKEENTLTYTENGAITRTTTLDSLLDLFAMGAAYRTRSDEDCILLFKKAFEENEEYAMKCLFYIRDILDGQGERRFFRVIMKWLAQTHPEAARRNLQYIPMFGRYDDLYTFVDTPLEKDAFAFIRKQLALDVSSKTPSLLAKWLKSINTSSKESRELGNKTREYLNMTAREYRKTLSILRGRINVLERLMSAGQWDKIEFDKIPSKAGMKYRNAFARHDVEQAYEKFMRDENTKVNAKALYPYEVVNKALNNDFRYGNRLNSIERNVINKYWENLTDVFNGYAYNGICVADVSGSMRGTPITVSISLAMYCAEHNKGPFANHFFTFSDNPQFVEIEGIDFVDKVQRISRADWGGSTNIEAVFDKMLKIAVQNHLRQEDLPQGVIVVSDMEFNSCVCGWPVSGDRWYRYETPANETLFETIEKRWNAAGYKLPRLTFWNVDARNNNIPMRKDAYVNYVSGFSATLFQQIMEGKTAYDLMFSKLGSDRYACIQ